MVATPGIKFVSGTVLRSLPGGPEPKEEKITATAVDSSATAEPEDDSKWDALVRYTWLHAYHVAWYLYFVIALLVYSIYGD